MLGAPHVDSGFITLLAQDGVAGLEVEDRRGDWIGVPPTEGALVVNFGKLLERWTQGRVRATRHLVVGSGAARFSIPFFYEPAVDAVIAPLGLGAGFAPITYGDLTTGNFMADFMNSYAWTIAGGSEEVQRNIVSERMLGMPREPKNWVL